MVIDIERIPEKGSEHHRSSGTAKCNNLLKFGKVWKALA